jgi:hypothetical protein
MHRLQNDLDEIILAKQEIIKSNYILVQNAESLREQLRTFVENQITIKDNSFVNILRVRTQAAEVRIVCASSDTLFDNLDESLPCLLYGDDDDTPDCENMTNQSDSCQSSLFSEINSLVWFICSDFSK